VQKWNATHVGFWLEAIGYSKYAPYFLEGGVDGVQLLRIRPENMRDILGVESDSAIRAINQAR